MLINVSKNTKKKVTKPRVDGYNVVSYTWNSAIWIDALEWFLFEILDFNPTALIGEAELFEDDEDFGRVWDKVWRSVEQQRKLLQ